MTVYADEVLSLNREWKQRWAEIKEKLGRHPTSHDNEYWKLTDWYHAEAEKLTVLRDGQKPARTKKAAETPAEPVERVCDVCGEPLVKKPGRGRWPKRHPECKDSAKGKGDG